jgi:hypothetical protein
MQVEGKGAVFGPPPPQPPPPLPLLLVVVLPVHGGAHQVLAKTWVQ